MSDLTVEELNDVSEVHVVLQDDVPVDLHQRQGDEEDEVTGRDTLGSPDGFPDCKHIVIHQLWKTHREHFLSGQFVLKGTGECWQVFDG